jgi:hypothetical protein
VLDIVQSKEEIELLAELGIAVLLSSSASSST